MITNYKKQLRQYLPAKEINILVKKIREKRNWNSKHFEKRYIERVLHEILDKYSNTSSHNHAG